MSLVDMDYGSHCISEWDLFVDRSVIEAGQMYFMWCEFLVSRGNMI